MAKEIFRVLASGFLGRAVSHWHDVEHGTMQYPSRERLINVGLFSNVAANRAFDFLWLDI